MGNYIGILISAENRRYYNFGTSVKLQADVGADSAMYQSEAHTTNATMVKRGSVYLRRA